MIITISGDPGSGKSTIAKMLAEELEMKRYYVGALRRKMAEERGLTLSQFNKLGEKEGFTDKEVDEWQKKLGEKEDNFIIEGRTSFHFIPHSVKIYLSVDEKEAARRIWGDLQKEIRKNESGSTQSLPDVLKYLRERKASDNRRYKKYYNLDAFNERHFDYTLDTTDRLVKEVFASLLGYINQRRKEHSKRRG